MVGTFIPPCIWFHYIQKKSSLSFIVSASVPHRLSFFRLYKYFQVETSKIAFEESSTSSIVLGILLRYWMKRCVTPFFKGSIFTNLQYWNGNTAILILNKYCSLEKPPLSSSRRRFKFGSFENWKMYNLIGNEKTADWTSKKCD